MIVQLRLLRRQERGADQLPQAGGGRGNGERARRIALRECGTCKALQRPRHSALVTQGRKDVQRFAVGPVRGLVVPFVAGDLAEIRERTGDSPTIAGLAEGEQRVLVKPARGGYVAALTRDVALLIQRT